MPPRREDAAYRLIESVIDRGHDDPDKQWAVAGPEACSMATPAFLDLRSAERFVDALNIAYCAGAAKVGTPVAIRISLDPRHEIVRRNGDAIGEVYDNGDGWQWELAGDALPPRRAVDRDAAINALVSAFNNRQTLPAALAGAAEPLGALPWNQGLDPLFWTPTPGAPEAGADWWVTVCSACLTAICWHGEQQCDHAKNASTAEKRASALRALKARAPRQLLAREDLARHGQPTEGGDDAMTRALKNPTSRRPKSLAEWREVIRRIGEIRRGEPPHCPLHPSLALACRACVPSPRDHWAELSRSIHGLMDQGTSIADIMGQVRGVGDDYFDRNTEGRS